MKGDILQINTSAGGLPKFPVETVEVCTLGIRGDLHNNRKYHGGPRQALLLVAAEAVDRLREEGWPLYYGALGENLTTRGLDPQSWRPGQRFRAGAIEIELTTPREPCRTLNRYGAGIQKRIFEKGILQGDYSSPLWGISGFYAAVTKIGNVKRLDIIEPVEIPR